jgi:hypothetical protein
MFAGVVNPPAYYVAIEQLVGGNDTIRIQRVDLVGAGLWAAASTGGVVVSSTPTLKDRLAMASDGVGTFANPKGAVLVWTESGAVRARRVSSAGVPQWASNGIAVCTASGTQARPAVANVGSDKLVVAWEDYRVPGTSRVYLQKIDSAGTLLWSATGFPLTLASDVQLDPKVLFASGGAFVVWRDDRSGAFRPYAQRIDANGVPMWDAAGIPLSDRGVMTGPPALVGDGAGGVIVTWKDTANDTGDIWAQRVDANGGRLWGVSGVPFGVAPNEQTLPVVATDGSGGAIAAWDDRRNGGLDIYANRVFAGGGVVEAPALAGSGGALRFARASASPTRGASRFSLELPSEAFVRVEVIDVLGRRVRTIAGETRSAGAHSLSWDGASESGGRVAPGVYFVRLRADDASRMERVVVVR